MEDKKRELIMKINLSDKWIYFFITLGILVIVAVGVYATAPTNPQDVGTATFGHTASELNFNGIGSGVIPLSAVSNAQQRITETCAEGSSIRGINADGTVACEVDDGVAGSTVYQIAKGCGGGLGTSPTCTTGICSTQYYYTCGGLCASHRYPFTCNNARIGQLLA